jgi:hypothetical protein
MLAGGTLIGAAGCALTVPLLAALLFGVDARDAVSVAVGLAALLALVAIATALLATRRASVVDPVVALRDM